MTFSIKRSGGIIKQDHVLCKVFKKQLGLVVKSLSGHGQKDSAGHSKTNRIDAAGSSDGTSPLAVGSSSWAVTSVGSATVVVVITGKGCWASELAEAFRDGWSASVVFNRVQRRLSNAGPQKRSTRLHRAIGVVLAVAAVQRISTIWSDDQEHEDRAAEENSKSDDKRVVGCHCSVESFQEKR